MIRRDHPLLRRRLGRNLGLGVSLVGLVGIVFALTVVKVTTGDIAEGYDHVLRPELAQQ